MKKFYLPLFLSLFIMSACGEDDDSDMDDMEEQQDDKNTGSLSGEIGGEPFELKYTKAIYNDIDDLFDTEFFGSGETEENPCELFISVLGYVKLQVPNATGTYAVPGDVKVRFEQAGSGNEREFASAGELIITSANGTEVEGTLDATFDTNNTVSGSFTFQKCTN